MVTEILPRELNEDEVSRWNHVRDRGNLPHLSSEEANDTLKKLDLITRIKILEYLSGK